MTNWTEELSDEHKEQIWHFIVETVKDIREQIAQTLRLLTVFGNKPVLVNLGKLKKRLQYLLQLQEDKTKNYRLGGYQ